MNRRRIVHNLAQGALVMKRYNPLVAPVSEEWLAMDELERLALVERYHRRAGVVVPNLSLHATLHAIVENQAALGDETPVRRTLARLMKERVDRHEALHAVASVLAEHVSDVARGVSTAPDPNVAYNAALEKLTIASWRRDFG